MTMTTPRELTDGTYRPGTIEPLTLRPIGEVITLPYYVRYAKHLAKRARAALPSFPQLPAPVPAAAA